MKFNFSKKYEDTIEFNLSDCVGSPYCIDEIDGKKVFAEISKAFDEDKSVIVSFDKIEMFTTAFLNATIGRIYRLYDEKTIELYLKFEGLSSDDSKRIHRFIESAKLFTHGNDSLKEKINSILGESGDLEYGN